MADFRWQRVLNRKKRYVLHVKTGRNVMPEEAIKIFELQFNMSSNLTARLIHTVCKRVDCDAMHRKKRKVVEVAVHRGKYAEK